VERVGTKGGTGWGVPKPWGDEEAHVSLKPEVKRRRKSVTGEGEQGGVPGDEHREAGRHPDRADLRYTKRAEGTQKGGHRSPTLHTGGSQWWRKESALESRGHDQKKTGRTGKSFNTKKFKSELEGENQPGTEGKKITKTDI